MTPGCATPGAATRWPPEPHRASALGAIVTGTVLAWARALGIIDFNDDDNFFDLGGSSVSAAQVIVELRAVHGMCSVSDLYANLQAFKPDGSSATIRLIYEPLVPWIWFGGLIVVLGSVLSILPARTRAVAEGEG